MDLKYSPTCPKKIRVMSDEEHSNDLLERSQFQFQCQSYHRWKAENNFFNPCIGATINELETLDFNVSDFKEVINDEVLTIPPNGTFCVRGEIKWLDYACDVISYGVTKKLREGQIIDFSSQQVPITIWQSDLIHISSVLEDTTYNHTLSMLSHILLMTLYVDFTS